MGDSSSSKNEAEIGLAEWTKKKEPVSYPFAKNEKEKFGFDVTKTDWIFDLLLQEGMIKLSTNHTILSTAELRNRKWHNAVLHSTSECRVFYKERSSSTRQRSR